MCVLNVASSMFEQPYRSVSSVKEHFWARASPSKSSSDGSGDSGSSDTTTDIGSDGESGYSSSYYSSESSSSDGTSQKVVNTNSNRRRNATSAACAGELMVSSFLANWKAPAGFPNNVSESTRATAAKSTDIEEHPFKLVS